MDKRKHYTQMSQDEIRVLMFQVRARKLSFAPHAFDRMREKSITQAQVLASISYGSIIEAHNNIPSELRVLVRAKVAGAYVCSVVSLTSNRIVTTYRNQANDFHKTLDKSAYTWDTDLTKINPRLLGESYGL